ERRLTAFRETLQELGWREGRNLRIDHRFAGAKADQYPVLARELVEARPDVLVGHSTPVTPALQRETRTIPIVFISVSDPVGAGFVASYAHPGGNITGFPSYTPAGVKWLELLKEIAPQVKRVAVLLQLGTQSPAEHFRSIESAAAAFDIQPLAISVLDA